MKKTPSRLRMIKAAKTITKDTIKIPTVTTKQDRLPNCGDIDYKNKREDAQGVPYTNSRFISPMESYKLMGFKEEDYLKAKKILIDNAKLRNLKLDSSAREKLLKQAGNSIVVNALELIFYYMNKLDK
jgi:DNA (cytosine-5)-methyltransferase 1